MPQFDVYRNPGKQQTVIPYVVVVQSSLYAQSQRRVVIPLVRQQYLPNLPETPLNPHFQIDNEKVILNPLEIVSIPAQALSDHIGSLKDQSDSILAACDALLSRSWD